eukprot:3192671-Pyramimonas_sp.AAC.1
MHPLIGPRPSQTSPTQTPLSAAAEAPQAAPSPTLNIMGMSQGQNATRTAPTRGGGARGRRGGLPPAGQASAVWASALPSG